MSVSKKVERYLHMKIPLLMREGYSEQQAIAIAFSMGKKAGYIIPRKHEEKP